MSIEKTFITSQITISNSGIVLVGPYLKTLFSHLGLLDENDFKNLDSQKKAILLLNYIVSGKKEVKGEDELALFKILCNLNPLEEIQIDSILEENEALLVDSMMTSILKQWNTLSTSTVEGFRENFLMRIGDLTEDEKAYILLIDKKPFDILLDSLPWEHKSIRLPWMKKIMLISWN
jgi:hypothetical protein